MQLYDHEFQGRGFLARLIRAAVTGQSPEAFVTREMAILERAAGNDRDVEGASKGGLLALDIPLATRNVEGLDGSA